VPAAAVIPAPEAYINVAAVKKLVVGSQDRTDGPLFGVTVCFGLHSRCILLVLLTECFEWPARLP
jgi:hypothetical protein